jgi:glycosyltransferase involved in cell wall biosynthesis
MDKISIIIPAFNIEKYISRCLDSVISQTYSNLEIIVVNDGSTDDTGKIIDEYASGDNRIIVVHKENAGVSSARNRGLEKATGDYIGFVDGDDIIDDDMYEFLHSNAMKYNADISHCGYKTIRPLRVDYYYNTGQIRLQDNKLGLIDLLKGEKIEPGLCNKLYKKKLFNNINYDSTIKLQEDLMLNILLFSKAQTSIYEDVAKYHYVLRKESATHTKFNITSVKDPLKVLGFINDFFKDNVEVGQYAKSKLISRNVNLYNQICFFKEVEYKECLKQIVHTLRTNLRWAYKNKNMSIKYKACMFGILYMPIIYKFIYKLSNKFLLNKNKYEIK